VADVFASEVIRLLAPDDPEIKTIAKETDADVRRLAVKKWLEKQVANPGPIKMK
jgi:hypothetical protein